MLGQLFVAVTVGILTAVMGWSAGFSAWGVLSYLVLGTNIGLLVGVGVANLSSRVHARRLEKSPEQQRRIKLGSLVMALLCSLALGWSITH